VGTPAVGDARRVGEIVRFAEDLNVTLLPWQEELFDRTLRLDGDGMYVARTCLALTARQSGKTLASGVRALAELCLWGGRLAVMAAHTRDLALESFRHTVELAEEADVPIQKVRRATGGEEMILADGGRLKVVSSTSGGGRGLSADLVVWDELREMRTMEPYSALEKSRRARPNSQMFCITTEGDHGSVVLNALQEQGRAAAAAGAANGIAYLEWSAAPERARDDVEGWRESNPGLGYLVSADVIAAELRSDPVETFETEVLGRKVAVAHSWLPASTWDGCADHAATVPDSAVGAVTFAADLTPDLQHGAIAVAWVRPDGRCHVEAISTHDGRTASVELQDRLAELVGRWQPRAVAVAGKGPAEALGARVAAATGTELVTVGPADLDRSARAFFEGAVTGRLAHPLDPVLADAVAAVEGDGGLIRLGRSVGNVTPAVAAVLATWAAERTPAVTAPTWVAW
jgi:hypothetical protein